VRLSKIYLSSYPSGWDEKFEVGSLTVLFGRNNAGKTNLLEAIYSVLAPQLFREGERPARGLRREHAFEGGLYVDLERGLAFDDAVLALVPDEIDEGFLGFRRLPPDQVCFAWTADNDSFPNPGSEPELWFVDPHDFLGPMDADGLIVDQERDELHVVGERTRLVGSEPSLRPLFLGWEFHDVDEWVTSMIASLSMVPDRMQADISGNRSFIRGSKGYLEAVQDSESGHKWRVRPEVTARLEQLTMLTNDLLPDFLDGLVCVELEVPTDWGQAPLVRVQYEERAADGEPRSLVECGRGTLRWLAIALQVALHIMEFDWVSSSLPVGAVKAYSGSVLLVDEPEAHLHPAAVASVVRWCERMVDCGFQVIAASHHETFLRSSNRGTRFVHVTRSFDADPNVAGGARGRVRSRARTLLTTETSVLQELATEVGMHPSVALSLHRGILFVEGTLDKAMLEEYAGPALDAAGVAIIPIHGTRNLEGLIDGEFSARLGIKTGVLTDNTDTSSLWERSNKKRSGEEKKVARLIQRFRDQGLPLPTLFGIPEDDLLFALPTGAIRDFLGGPFPGWEELREECRKAEGRGPSDSVDWKAHAVNNYRLPIATEDGVRRVVRALDLAGVQIPTLSKVTAEIIDWAKSY
jgi:hypothetical protein